MPTATPSLDEILALEHRIWQALVDGSPEDDSALLHDTFLGVGARGFICRAQHSAQLSAGPIVKSYQLTDARLMVLQSDLVMLAYRAEYTWSAAPATPGCMYISSLWRRYPSGWLNLFSQDTKAASRSQGISAEAASD